MSHVLLKKTTVMVTVVSHAETVRMKTAAIVRCACIDCSIGEREKREMTTHCLETRLAKDLSSARPCDFQGEKRQERETKRGKLEEMGKFCQVVEWGFVLLVKQQW